MSLGQSEGMTDQLRSSGHTQCMQGPQTVLFMSITNWHNFSVKYHVHVAHINQKLSSFQVN